MLYGYHQGREKKQSLPMDDSAENYMHLDSTSGQLISLEDQQKVVKTAAEQLLNLLAGICVAPASVMSWLPLESL